MLSKLLAKMFGTKHDRDVQRLDPIVEEVNEWAEEYQALTDEQFPEKTQGRQ
jgi:preprotein translocase subunit SecA